MSTFIIRRLIQAILVIFLVSLLVFFLVRFLPGDPILIYLAKEEYQTLTMKQINEMKSRLGMDRPIIVQYFSWLNDIFHTNMGTSLFYQEEVSKLLKERFPVTLYLGILAFILSSLIGITAGTVSALRRGKVTDTIITLLANAGICLPIFWMGILLIYLFGLKLQFLPLYGFTSPFDDFWVSIKQSILPIICLAIFAIASKTRQTRSSVLEVIQQDYVRTAWSKGLKERTVVIRHIIKNSLIPVITLLGFSFSHIIGGSVFIETVFSIPGIGRLSVEALFNQDYAIIQAVTLLVAVAVVSVNLLVDIAYGWIDPRIRYSLSV